MSPILILNSNFSCPLLEESSFSSMARRRAWLTTSLVKHPIRRMMVPFVQSADRFSMIFMITTIRFRDIETISNKKRILFTEKIEIYIVFVVFLLYDVLNEPEEDTNDYIY